jgi:hypothetical protein
LPISNYWDSRLEYLQVNLLSHSSSLHHFSVAEAEKRTDRLFVGLLWAHFAASLLLSLWYGTWAEAFLIGIPAALVVTLLAWMKPGTALVRCTAGVALMVFSALFIQQTHGLTEAHFHVFCALAFLLAYRDWRAIAAAAVTIAIHHAAFTVLQTLHVPVYIYTSDTVSLWALTAIHAGFVVFESGILILLAIQMRKEWEQTEDLSRMTQALADGRLTGDDLTFRLDWPADSPLAVTKPKSSKSSAMPVLPLVKPGRSSRAVNSSSRPFPRCRQEPRINRARPPKLLARLTPRRTGRIFWQTKPAARPCWSSRWPSP